MMTKMTDKEMPITLDDAAGGSNYNTYFTDYLKRKLVWNN